MDTVKKVDRKAVAKLHVSHHISCANLLRESEAKHVH
jgi:hypothetical protein